MTPFVRLVEAAWRTVSNTLATRMPCHFDLAILWICQRFEKRASLLYVALITRLLVMSANFAGLEISARLC